MRFPGIDLPSFTNVVAGSTATLGLPVGRTYEKILLDYSGSGAITRAQLKNIRVEVNGKPLQEYKDGDQLAALNAFYGRTDNTGFLTIYFNRPEMDFQDGIERLTGLGTADVDTVTLRIDIDSGATTPDIRATAETNDPMPLGAITKVKRFPTASLTSGENALDTLVTGPRIIAMHLFKSDISEVAVQVNGRRIVDAKKTVLQELQQQVGRVPQSASATHVDFCMDGDLSQALVTDKAKGISDFRVLPTLDTSGAIEVVVEYLDGYQGI